MGVFRSVLGGFRYSLLEIVPSRGPRFSGPTAEFQGFPGSDGFWWVLTVFDVPWLFLVGFEAYCLVFSGF